MPLTDMPLEQLVEYTPTVAEPADFDEFWTRTLAEARELATPPSLSRVESPITQFVIDDLTFSGFAGEQIRGWLTRPAGANGPLPTVIEFLGYGGGRGIPGENLRWAASGYVHILMDTRGHVSAWGAGGDTPDPHGSSPGVRGNMTRGIQSPDTYYYRRVFTDAAMLVETARQFDFVDAERVIVTGGSQGGAISLAAAGLSEGLFAVMPDVPFLCHFRRSVEITPSGPFPEVATYLNVYKDRVDQVFETLSYFDGVNFARRATAPARFSVALMDDIVMPSSVFAAYNHYGHADRHIDVYQFNGHEGGQGHQWLRQANWLRDRLG